LISARCRVFVDDGLIFSIPRDLHLRRIEAFTQSSLIGGCLCSDAREFGALSSKRAHVHARRTGLRVASGATRPIKLRTELDFARACIVSGSRHIGASVVSGAHCLGAHPVYFGQQRGNSGSRAAGAGAPYGMML
jgi:hypothetical protein